MAKVLITGGAGFIGHHLVEFLLQNTDHDIVILDRLDLSGSLSRVKHVVDQDPSYIGRVDFVWHDLKAAISEFVANQLGEVEYILHLAAGSHVDRSITHPMEFVLDNVVGTANLLDYCRTKLKSSLKFFLYFSTDEVFGTAPEGVLYKEWDRYDSGNPYSASKAGAEELCIAYANTYSLPIHVTHTMNVIGARQHPEKFLPLAISKVMKGEKIYIHSSPDLTVSGSRFYIDVKDVCSAVSFLMKHCVDNDIRTDKFNIVGSREISNLELAQMIAKEMGKDLIYEMVDFHSSRPGHDLRYSLCGEKMKNLGWEPHSIEQRIKDFVKWYTEPANSGWLF
mgnify:CR=1 FL=1